MTTLDGAVDLARDRELVERCQMGDEGSFAELYDRYNRRLLRFCLRRLHSHDDAEEAVQEAFTRAWRALPQFGGDRRFYPWLTVIAGNVCTDMLRRQARVVPMDEVPRRAAELDEEAVDEHLLREVDLAMATEALGHLSDRHQRVLRLRESTEWSAQKIAEYEGVAVPAVDTLLWRARQAFKREFAVLSDAGGLAGILGLGVASLKRSVARVWLRAASHLPGHMRGPGAITATVVLTGAAIAGGGVALVGVSHARSHSPAALSSSTAPTVGSGAVAPTSKEAGTGASAGSGGTAAATTHEGRADGSRGSSGAVMSGSALSGIAGGTGTGAPLGATGSKTAIGQVVSGVGGIVGSVTGALSSAGSSQGTNLSTAVGSVGSAVGSVGSAVGGTVSSVAGTVGGTVGSVIGGVTGSSGTGTSGASGPASSGTLLRTLVHTTTPPVVSPSSGSSGSSATGSSGSGSLLGGL